MITVSLCMIVKNEEDTLRRCLESAREIADEIIVVDTGSTDATKKVARRFTNHVYDFKWIDDFSAARNFAFDKATQEYQLWLDADDLLLPDDRNKFALLKQTLDPAVDAVMMKYNTGFDAQGRVTFSYYRERLVRRACRFRWREPVHEYLETGGRIINSDICVTHAKTHEKTGNRNMLIYENLLAHGEALSCRGLYYYARELKDNGRYDDAIAFFNKFLDTGAGWVEDNICACAELARCHAHERQPELQYRALTRSFYYDTPRAEICCQLGYFHKAAGDYRRAAFWFGLATTLQKPEGGWGFIEEDCWGYVPCIELAVCHDRLGDPEKARGYNERAARYKPDDPAVLYNRRYFGAQKETTRQE